MANKHIVGVELQVTSGGTQATDTLSRSLENLYKEITEGNKRMAHAMRQSAAESRRLSDAVRASMRSAERSTNNATVGMIHFNQAVASATTGLSHMYRYGVSALRGIGAALTDITADSASRLDTTMANLDIVLGRIGSNTTAEVERSYQAAMGRIRELAMSTQFTMEDVGDSFTRLFQAGFAASDAIGTLDDVLAFSTASAGAVALEDSASLAALSVTALGSSVEDIGENFAQMLRATQETRLQVQDFATLFQSMQTSSATFSASTTQDLLAVVGAQRQMGRSVAQSGNDLANTARSMGYLVRALTTGNEDGTAGGMRGGRMRQLAASKLGVTLEDFTDAEGNYLDLISMIERVGERFSRASEEMGSAQAEAQLQALFGSQQARNLIVNSQRYEATYGRSIRSLAGAIDDSGTILEDAQERVLETFAGQAALIMGVWDNLKAEIGLQSFPALKRVMGVLFRVLGSLSEMVRMNPEVVRKLFLLGAYLTALGAVFTAVAGIGMVFGTMMMVTAPLMTALGSEAVTLVNILKQVGAVGLRPLAAILGPVAGIFIALTGVVLGFAYVMRNDVFGSATRVRGWVAELRIAFDVFRQIITADGIDSSRWLELTERQQRLVIGLRRALTIAQDSLSAFLAGLQVGMAPILLVGALLAGMFSLMVSALNYVLVALGKETWAFEGLSGAMQVAAAILGFAIGVWITFKTIVLLSTAALGIQRVFLMLHTLATTRLTRAMFRQAFATMLVYGKWLLIIGAVALLTAMFLELPPSMQAAIGALALISGLIWLATRRTAIWAATLAVLKGAAGLAVLGLKGLGLGISFAVGYNLAKSIQYLMDKALTPLHGLIQSIIHELELLTSLFNTSFVRRFNEFMLSDSVTSTAARGTLALASWGTSEVMLDHIYKQTREAENFSVMQGVSTIEGLHGRDGSELPDGWVTAPPRPDPLEGFQVVPARTQRTDQQVDASIRIENLTVQASDSSEAGARALLEQVERLWGQRVSRELRRSMQGT